MLVNEANSMPVRANFTLIFVLEEAKSTIFIDVYFKIKIKFMIQWLTKDDINLNAILKP